MLPRSPTVFDTGASAYLLAVDGRIASSGPLVAVLPASMNAKDMLPEWDGEWSAVPKRIRWHNRVGSTDGYISAYFGLTKNPGKIRSQQAFNLGASEV